MKALLLALLTIVGIASTAEAQSRHERLDIKPLKEGGETVGIKLKLTLRPQVSRDGSIVRIGIGQNNWATFSAQAGKSDHRKAASDKQFGYAIYQHEIQGIQSDAPQEVTLDIPYTDLPGVTPGDNIDVFTAWNKPGANYWHVFGLNQNDKSLILKTPAAKLTAAPKTKTSAATTKAAPKAKLGTTKSKIAAAAKPAATSQAKAKAAVAARKTPAKTKSGK